MSSLLSMKTDIHVLSLKNVSTKPLKFIQSKWELATLRTGYSAGVHLSKRSSLAKPIKVTSISRSVKGLGMSISYKPGQRTVRSSVLWASGKEFLPF